jgi:hypothetical protein
LPTPTIAIRIFDISLLVCRSRFARQWPPNRGLDLRLRRRVKTGKR